MFDVGGGELILIILAVLVLFGPQKIPEVAQMVGKGMKKIKEAQAQFQSQFDELQSEVKSVMDEPYKSVSVPQNTSDGSPHKIGVYDQIGVENNFVTDYKDPYIQSTDSENDSTIELSDNNLIIDEKVHPIEKLNTAGFNNENTKTEPNEELDK